MRRILVVPALLLAPACTPNQLRPAQDFGSAKEVSANPKRHDCVATGGNWAKQPYRQESHNFSFSGQLVAVSLTKHDEWYSTATVRGDFGDERGPYLRIFAPKGDAAALRLVIGSARGETEIQKVALNEIVQFRYTVAGPQVRVEANGSTFTFDRPSTPVAGMATSCSTGHFRFDKLKVQTLAEPPSSETPVAEIAAR